MVSVGSLITRLSDLSDVLVFFVYRDDSGAWHLTDFAPVAAFQGEIWFDYLDLAYHLDEYKNGASDLLKDVDVIQIKRLFGVE